MILLYIIGGLGVFILLDYYIIPFFTLKYVAWKIYRLSKKILKECKDEHTKDMLIQVNHLSKEILKDTKLD